MPINLMTRFLRATPLALGGEADERRRLTERDLVDWPANEDGSRPTGRGLWSAHLDLAQLVTLASIPQDEEDAEGFVYRRFRVLDEDDNLIAEGDGVFHTAVEWSWTDPLGYAAQHWGAASILFLEGVGKTASWKVREGT